MKKYFLLFLLFITNLQQTFANQNDLGIFGDQCGISKTDFREGNKIHIDDIPCFIQGAINFFLGIAGTIAVIFIIIGAYKILFGSLSQDTTKGKDTIIMALTGFAIASLSWFIIKFLINNMNVVT
ncbi:MAG: hypothetical protein GY828_04920 [Candidatus Gracilibacteria bacterium]|nr:hypothetical protein [Candidatus Gracilibacteria bacterium]